MKKKKSAESGPELSEEEHKELLARLECHKRLIKIIDKLRKLGLPEDDLDFLLKWPYEDVFWMNKKMDQRKDLEIKQIAGN